MDIIKENKNELVYQFSFSVPKKIPVKGGKRTSSVQIAKAGTFSRQYSLNPMVFDDTVFDLMISNFTDGVYGDPSVGLPFDAEHRSELGAYGWIKKLFKKKADKDLELWAEVDWTSVGVQVIEEERFKWTSITYYPIYVNELSERYSFVVAGAALTVDPFLKGMEPVSLSRFRELSKSNVELENKKATASLQREIVEKDLLGEEIKNKEEVEQMPKNIVGLEEELSKLGMGAKDVANILNSLKEDKEKIEELNKEMDSLRENSSKEIDSLKEKLGTEKNLKEKAEVKAGLFEKRVLKIETDSVISGWFDNSERVIFKTDMREKVAKFHSQLKQLDRGLVKFSAEIDFTKGFEEIINSVSVVKVNLTEKGYSRIVEDEIVEKIPEGVSKEGYVLDVRVERFMAETGEENYKEAFEKMIKLKIIDGDGTILKV